MRIDKGRSNRRPLHLIQNIANFLKVGDVRSVGIQSALTRGALGEGVNEELESAAGVDLEVQGSGDWVLPQLGR
jgi:hypothetical protein